LFVSHQIGISFDHCDKSTAEVTPVVSLEINTVKADYRKQTWDDVAVVTVAKISILSHLLDGKNYKCTILSPQNDVCS